MNNSARITKRLKHLQRLRWGVFAGVVVGILVSIATNVLHAPANPISQAIAAWPPLALFGGIELISRIPSSNRWLSAGRILATLAVAGVAGSISYGHMIGTVEKYGEAGWQASIWPISVDGLMIVASLSLVEVVAKIRQLESLLDVDDVPIMTTAPVTPVSAAPVVAVTPVVPVTPVPVTPVAPVLPVPVAPAAVPGPMVTAQQVVRQTTATLPIPVSPAPAGRRDRTMVSPLTGRVLMDAPPKA